MYPQTGSCALALLFFSDGKPSDKAGPGMGTPRQKHVDPRPDPLYPQREGAREREMDRVR